MEINFISSKPYSDKTRTMHTKSNNVEFMMSSKTEEAIKELFESLLKTYQKSMRGSEFIFDVVNALYDDLTKTNLNRGGSYVDSLEWLKSKRATIN